MANHSSILAWRVPWREESGGLPSRGGKGPDITKHRRLIMYTHDSSLEEKYMQSYTCCHIMKFNFRYLGSWLSKREICVMTF